MRVLKPLFLCLAVSFLCSSCQLAQALMRTPGTLLRGLGNMQLVENNADAQHPLMIDAEMMKLQREMQTDHQTVLTVKSTEQPSATGEVVAISH